MFTLILSCSEVLDFCSSLVFMGRILTKCGQFICLRTNLNFSHYFLIFSIANFICSDQVRYQISAIAEGKMCSFAHAITRKVHIKLTDKEMVAQTCIYKVDVKLLQIASLDSHNTEGFLVLYCVKERRRRERCRSSKGV